MANKRMFSKAVIHNDSFLDMSADARALYLQLNMIADDMGIISNVKRNLRYFGAGEKELKELENNGYILEFESQGKPIIVIKHWLVHNTQKADRVEQTIYADVLEKLFVDSTKIYTTDASKDDATKHPTYFKNSGEMEQNGTVSKKFPKSFQKVSKSVPQERKEERKENISSFSGGSFEELHHYGREEKAPEWYKGE